MKNILISLFSIAVIFAAVSVTAAQIKKMQVTGAQKQMQVTVVNNSPEPITGVNLMSGEVLVEDYKAVKPLRFSGAIKPNGSATFSLVVDVIKPTRAEEGVALFLRKYAIEVLWGGGCKKIIDLKYQLATQTVNAGAKQCGLYDFEKARVHWFKEQGDSHYRSKDYGMAADHYSWAIKIDPKNEDALHKRGHAFASQQKYTEAIRDFTMALTISASPAHLYTDRGNAYYGAKDYVRAAEDYSSAYRLKPNMESLKTRWAANCRAGNKEAVDADGKELLKNKFAIRVSCEEWLLTLPK